MKVLGDDDRQVGYIEMRSEGGSCYERYKIYEQYRTNKLFIHEYVLDTENLDFDYLKQKYVRTYFNSLQDVFAAMKKRGLFVVWEG